MYELPWLITSLNLIQFFRLLGPQDSIGLIGYIRRAFDILTGRRNSQNLSIKNPFRFQSAYDNTEHTIYTTLFANCVDYMYYSSDRQRLVQVFCAWRMHRIQKLTRLFSLADGAAAHDRRIEGAYGTSIEKVPIRSFGAGV